MECKQILDDFAAVPRDRSPEFLDRRAEMAEKLVALVRSGSPPEDLRGRVEAFAIGMSGQARYDRESAAALRAGTASPTPPDGDVPSLGLKCGDSSL